MNSGELLRSELTHLNCVSMKSVSENVPGEIRENWNWVQHKMSTSEGMWPVVVQRQLERERIQLQKTKLS